MSLDSSVTKMTKNIKYIQKLIIIATIYTIPSILYAGGTCNLNDQYSDACLEYKEAQEWRQPETRNDSRFNSEELSNYVIQNTAPSFGVSGLSCIDAQENYEKVGNAAQSLLNDRNLSDFCVQTIKDGFLKQNDKYFYLAIKECKQVALSFAAYSLNEYKNQAETCRVAQSSKAIGINPDADLNQFVTQLIESYEKKYIQNPKKLPLCHEDTKESKNNCVGSLSFSNASYIGEIKNSKPDGFGTFTYTNLDKQYGYAVDGLADGDATYIFHNGSKYIGQWKQGKWHGKGAYIDNNGLKIYGDYKDGILTGICNILWNNGTKYSGNCENGLPNGNGTKTMADGDVLLGRFFNGEAEGFGTIKSKWGERYSGEFKDGKFDGSGTLTGAFNEKYKGKFKAGQKNGEGSISFSNGDSYNGEWKDDKFDGHGYFYDKLKNQTFGGIWKDNKLVEIELTEKEKIEIAEKKAQDERYRQSIANREKAKRDLISKSTYTAIFSCGTGASNIHILACFAPEGYSPGTELEIRNGRNYGMYKVYNMSALGIEDDSGFYIPLEKSFGIKAQNSSSNLMLGLKIINKNGNIVFQKTVSKFGVIFINNNK